MLLLFSLSDSGVSLTYDHVLGELGVEFIFIMLIVPKAPFGVAHVPEDVVAEFVDAEVEEPIDYISMTSVF